MTKKKYVNLYSLIADLIQELLNIGYDENNIIFMLNQYGITEEEAKEWYGIPYEEKKD